MRRLGATCISCVVAIAGFVAVGGAGYMTMTGKSICSIAGACGEKDKSAEATKAVNTVANKEGGEKKSCCPLSKAQTVANKEGGCSGASEAKVTQVAAKDASECAKACAGEAKVTQAAAKDASECAKACAGEAKTVKVAAKEGSACAKACSSTAKATRFGTSVVMAGQTPVVMPAMFFNPAAKVEKISLKETGGCTEAAKAACAAKPEACCSKAKVENAAAKEDAGCCKGTGKRADGQPCKNEGEHCKEGDKAADKKAGEPVASRQ